MTGELFPVVSPLVLEIGDALVPLVNDRDDGGLFLFELVPAMQDCFRPATWQAFWEHVVEEKPAAQVAAELGLSVAAVYKAKLRVLNRLHQELADLISD